MLSGLRRWSALLIASARRCRLGFVRLRAMVFSVEGEHKVRPCEQREREVRPQ